MTDEVKRIAELLDQLAQYCSCGFMSDPDGKCVHCRARTALTAARQDALREAAKVVRRCRDKWHSAAADLALMDARDSILALASQAPAQREGE